jgi:hypothetical protein
VTAEIVVPSTGAEGVIVAQGGSIGGWSLYARGGKLKYCYNLLGIQYFYAESSRALTPGDHQVRMEFAYAGSGLGKGGTASLYVDGQKVGGGIVGATAAMIFSADDGCDVGEDSGSPVSPDYGSRGNGFTGRVKAFSSPSPKMQKASITLSRRRRPSVSRWRGSRGKSARATGEVSVMNSPPLAFHLLAKPTGAKCNLDCTYCFFLSKEMLYPGDRFRMSGQMLERYIRQLLEAQPLGEVNVAWQGGEPTLMGSTSSSALSSTWRNTAGRVSASCTRCRPTESC